MSYFNDDIYEYQFSALFNHVKGLLGRDTIKTYDSEEEEREDKEFDKLLNESSLLFDISGNDFKRFKVCDSEYRYWVEVYIIKIIENLMTRAGIEFQEKYYNGSNEQHSIIINEGEKKTEVYFLFDIAYEEANRTDYDKLAENLKSRSQNVEQIDIYIFRNDIGIPSLAYLINGDMEKSADGMVKIFPLRVFFEKYFTIEEYNNFIQYANDFYSKCNNIISYKTVITPTPKTISAFRQKKGQMLKNMDYSKVAAKGKSGELTSEEFDKVKESFINNKMYMAMISSNDYADSFISAEWSYDVYSNSMGELELTGIIAGYLKSIEQLLFKVARFHRDQGIKIKTSQGYQPYTYDNEQIIDSTLGALNEFLTSSEGKLARSRNIRGCIRKAIDLWRKYQRNGYFHKDNLYSQDNKINEVRELTLYLYFLILGGISFTSEEIESLGVKNHTDKESIVFDENRVYPKFKMWLDNIILYDLPERVPGLWILMNRENDAWEASVYLMKYFYIDDFESGAFGIAPDQRESNHVHDISPFVWIDDNDNILDASLNFQKMIGRYKAESGEKINKIDAIIMDFGKYTQLIHVNT